MMVKACGTIHRLFGTIYPCSKCWQATNRRKKSENKSAYVVCLYKTGKAPQLTDIMNGRLQSPVNASLCPVVKSNQVPLLKYCTLVLPK